MARPAAPAGWRLVEPLWQYQFQGVLPVARWRAAPADDTNRNASTGSGAAGEWQYFIDLTPVTKAVLQDQAFSAWREAALWRQLYPQDGYAEVVTVSAGAWPAVVQRLGAQWRPLLLPAQAGGERRIDAAIGRSLPERLAVPLIRRLVATAVFVLEKSRSLGPTVGVSSGLTQGPAGVGEGTGVATPLEEIMAGLYFLPDLTSPRVRWLSPYVALPCAPDNHGRRPVGPLLALVATAVLTGRYDAAVTSESLAALRPGLTTQLPAWIESLRRYDGSGAPARLLEQFDAAIGQIDGDVVGGLYRPLGS